MPNAQIAQMRVGHDRIADVDIQFSSTDSLDNIKVTVYPAQLNITNNNGLGVLDTMRPLKMADPVVLTADYLSEGTLTITGMEGNEEGSQNQGKGLGTLAMNSLIAFLQYRYPESTTIAGIVDHPSRGQGSESRQAKNQMRRIHFLERFGFEVLDHDYGTRAGKIETILSEVEVVKKCASLGDLPASIDVARMDSVKLSGPSHGRTQNAEQAAARSRGAG